MRASSLLQTPSAPCGYTPDRRVELLLDALDARAALGRGHAARLQALGDLALVGLDDRQFRVLLLQGFPARRGEWEPTRPVRRSARQEMTRSSGTRSFQVK